VVRCANGGDQIKLPAVLNRRLVHPPKVGLVGTPSPGISKRHSRGTPVFATVTFSSLRVCSMTYTVTLHSLLAGPFVTLKKVFKQLFAEYKGKANKHGKTSRWPGAHAPTVLNLPHAFKPGLSGCRTMLRAYIGVMYQERWVKACRLCCLNFKVSGSG
jgi:hypothetical protein